MLLLSEPTDIFIKNMPVLRAAAHLTQAQLAEKTGVSRQTIIAIEKQKRHLPRCLHLASVYVFEQNAEAKELMYRLNLFPSDL